MVLHVNFLNVNFLLKKTKKNDLNRVKIWFVYSLLLKKINFFLMIQGCSYLIPKIIKPKWVYVLNFKVLDKNIFNLVFLDIFNLVKQLQIVKLVKFYSSSMKQRRFTVLRSSFVNKKSREQLLINYYNGSFSSSFLINSYLLSDFIQFYFHGVLSTLFVFNFRKIKKIIVV